MKIKVLQACKQANLILLAALFLSFLISEKSFGQCSINFLSYESNYISEDSISICYNFTYENNVSDSYQVLFNDKLIKTANYNALASNRCFAISKNDFDINNQLLVQDMERLSCSESINVNVVFDIFQSGSGCYKNFFVEKTDCKEDGSFFVTVDFTPNYYSEEGSFIMFSNNRQLGEFKYEDLPLNLGPYFGTKQIDFNFKDTEYFCAGNIQVYSGACLPLDEISGSNFDPACAIANLSVKQTMCATNENKTNVILNFNSILAESENFYLYYYFDDLTVDSVLYQYTDLPIEIDNLIADGFTSYGIAVADAENSFCKSEVFLPELSCVFPGNTNGDLNNTVNHIDLLKIGEAFGENGPARLNRTVNPTMQIAESWNNFFNNGWNYKHADCNGNGVIDKKDALIIKQNYSRKSFKNETHKYLNFKNEGIPIGAEIPTQTIGAQSEIVIPIMFGDEENLVNDLYGIAFSLNIDTNYTDIKSFKLDATDSWLNSDSDEILSLIGFNEFDSQLNVSLTKTNCESISGYGQIANLRITIMVEIEPEKRAEDFEITVADVVISNKSAGFESIVNKGLKQIESKAIVVTDVPEFDSHINFQVYPTPTYNVLNINTNSVNTTTIEIFNLIGTNVYSSTFKNNTSINTALWPSSIYYLYLESGEYTKQQKILMR